jgi:hypothetical protein
MAAAAWVIHEAFKELVCDGTIDLDTHVFKMGLALNASNVSTTSINTYASITSEHANQYGYTTGGKSITNVTWNRSGGTVTFGGDNVTWTAAGGSIVMRKGFIYCDSDASKTVVAHSVLETDTNTFTVNISAGIFDLT